MNHEAADDIAEDTMRDEALAPCPCEVCVLARLCDRQRDAITKLTEELEAERGRNRVLGFQIRTLREGK